VRSRHVSGDITRGVWPWTRFAWRETAALPPGLYKAIEPRCPNTLQFIQIMYKSHPCCFDLTLSSLKLCVCLMFVNLNKKLFDHSVCTSRYVITLVLRLFPLSWVQISSTDVSSWIQLPECISYHYDDGEYFQVTPNNSRNYILIVEPSILGYRCKMTNRCLKELVDLLMYSIFTPKCFGKCLQSSGGRSETTDHTGRIVIHIHPQYRYSKTCLTRTPYIPETWTNGK
jgi:hypothetical protein